MTYVGFWPGAPVWPVGGLNTSDEGCDLIFHNEGQPITDYRKCWHSACVLNGLGHFYCRTCKGADGNFISTLDATRKCPTCGRKWTKVYPKFIGRLLHDFRRSACYEMWKSGSTIEECMEVSDHSTPAMFKRYAELFTDEEKQARQRAVQARRKQWRDAQPDNLVEMPVNQTAVN